MRKICALVAVAALAAIAIPPAPSAAFGLRVGPFYVGLPFYWHRHRHHVAPARAPAPETHTASLRDDAEPGAAAPVQSPLSALLYPAVALPAVYDNIFSAPSPPAWPFSYQAIFQAAFAKAKLDPAACQRPIDANAVIARIGHQVRPTGAQVQQLQKLGGALRMAGQYLASACPNDIPAQPVARMQLMEWQIEKLAQALDIVRPPLAEFQQSLNDAQRARFAATAATPSGTVRPDRASTMMPACAATPTTIDWSLEQISLSVEPTDAQRDAMSTVKTAFRNAASELDATCPSSLPPDPLARLQAIEARLDATWRAVLAIQSALATFENTLSDEQRVRFDATDFAVAQ
jgi:LTXXQ motif family protein